MRVMILCNTACSASSVGAGTSTNSGAPSVPRRYTPSSTRQCRWMLRFAADPIVKVRLDQPDRAAVDLVGLQTDLPEQVARDHAVGAA